MTHTILGFPIHAFTKQNRSDIAAGNRLQLFFDGCKWVLDLDGVGGTYTGSNGVNLVGTDFQMEIDNLPNSTASLNDSVALSTGPNGDYKTTVSDLLSLVPLPPAVTADEGATINPANNVQLEIDNLTDDSTSTPSGRIENDHQTAYTTGANGDYRATRQEVTSWKPVFQSGSSYNAEHYDHVLQNQEVVLPPANANEGGKVIVVSKEQTLQEVRESVVPGTIFTGSNKLFSDGSYIYATGDTAAVYDMSLNLLYSGILSASDSTNNASDFYYHGNTGFPSIGSSVVKVEKGTWTVTTLDTTPVFSGQAASVVALGTGSLWLLRDGLYAKVDIATFTITASGASIFPNAKPALDLSGHAEFTILGVDYFVYASDTDDAVIVNTVSETAVTVPLAIGTIQEVLFLDGNRAFISGSTGSVQLNVSTGVATATTYGPLGRFSISGGGAFPGFYLGLYQNGAGDIILDEAMPVNVAPFQTTLGNTGQTYTDFLSINGRYYATRNDRVYELALAGYNIVPSAGDTIAGQSAYNLREINDVEMFTSDGVDTRYPMDRSVDFPEPDIVGANEGTNIIGGNVQLEIDNLTRTTADTTNGQVEDNHLVALTEGPNGDYKATMSDVKDYILYNENNYIYVDAVNGDDATGVPYRADLPYQTIGAAYAAATSGPFGFDVVYVRPGVYQGAGNQDIPLSVATFGFLYVHFESGVFLNPDPGLPVFSDGGSRVNGTLKITGKASLQGSGQFCKFVGGGGGNISGSIELDNLDGSLNPGEHTFNIPNPVNLSIKYNKATIQASDDTNRVFRSVAGNGVNFIEANETDLSGFGLGTSSYVMELGTNAAGKINVNSRIEGIGSGVLVPSGSNVYLASNTYSGRFFSVTLVDQGNRKLEGEYLGPIESKSNAAEARFKMQNCTVGTGGGDSIIETGTLGATSQVLLLDYHSDGAIGAGVTPLTGSVTNIDSNIYAVL